MERGVQLESRFSCNDECVLYVNGLGKFIEPRHNFSIVIVMYQELKGIEYCSCVESYVWWRLAARRAHSLDAMVASTGLFWPGLACSVQLLGGMVLLSRPRLVGLLMSESIFSSRISVCSVHCSDVLMRHVAGCAIS